MPVIPDLTANVWLIGRGALIASFLDDQALDEFVVDVVPMFIGDGISTASELFLPSSSSAPGTNTCVDWTSRARPIAGDGISGQLGDRTNTTSLAPNPDTVGLALDKIIGGTESRSGRLV